jgi:hypothetical protein
MAADVARRHPANNSDSTTRARHTEIARRYAWQAQQQRKWFDDKPDPARLLTLIRMRELERLFVRRSAADRKNAWPAGIVLLLATDFRLIPMARRGKRLTPDPMPPLSPRKTLALTAQ